MKSFFLSQRHFLVFAVTVSVLVFALVAWAQKDVSTPPEPVLSPDLLAHPPLRSATEAEDRAPAGNDDPLPINELIVRIVRNQMPRGGVYATTATAFAGLRAATGVDNNCLDVQPDRAQPSFCSGATYLVFLTVVEQLQRQGRLTLDAETMEKLLVRSQPDGSGVWGRWNANGPGTARLFHELHLGTNFTSFSEARPGDFVKLFWNDGIGSTERGHSAIFLGLERDHSGEEFVNYWSSNQATGFGYGRKERSKVRRVLFSRLEHPSALTHVRSLPAKDDYLAAMLKRPSTPAEMYRMVGLPADTEPEESSPAPRRVENPPAISSGSAAAKSPSPKRFVKVTPTASPTPEKKKGLFSR